MGHAYFGVFGFGLLVDYYQVVSYLKSINPNINDLGFIYFAIENLESIYPGIKVHADYVSEEEYREQIFFTIENKYVLDDARSSRGRGHIIDFNKLNPSPEEIRKLEQIADDFNEERKIGYSHFTYAE